jgi:hypothetical protein
MPRERITDSLRRQVLTEAGYRCAVPTCRSILALDLHHIEEVQDGGPNELGNLIALCPTCHALYTRGTISRDAITAWKTMLVALSHAFDGESISNLLFLVRTRDKDLVLSGDGVLKFSQLIASELADFRLFMQNGPIVLYKVDLTERGVRIVNAWFSGRRDDVRSALNEFR